jgi:hypothetical protein
MKECKTCRFVAGQFWYFCGKCTLSPLNVDKKDNPEYKENYEEKKG